MGSQQSIQFLELDYHTQIDNSPAHRNMVLDFCHYEKTEGVSRSNWSKLLSFHTFTKKVRDNGEV